MFIAADLASLSLVLMNSFIISIIYFCFPEESDTVVFSQTAQKHLAIQSSGREEWAGCFAFIVFWMSCFCKCSVTLPRAAVGWSAVSDCGIS